MADTNFQDVTAEDFGEKLPAGTNPATGKPFTGVEIANAVVGQSPASEIEPNPMKRALAGAGMMFANKIAGVQGKPAVESYGLERDPAGSAGMILPEFASAVAPARVLPQAAFGAVSGAMDPAANVLERGVNALKGAAINAGGQMLASGLVRGANAAAGNLSRPGQVGKAAGAHGLDLSAGDLTDSNVLRELEKRSIASPTAKQGEQVAVMMADVNNNPLTNAVMNAYQTAQGKVTGAANRLDDLIAQGNLPAVTPRETAAALRHIAERSPGTLNAVNDPVLMQRIEAIVSAPAGRIPKGMSFSELDELRRAFGPIMAKIETQSKSGASNINTADANRWKQLYKSIMTDIDNWGSKSATEDALAAHKELRETFKNEVLPLREHPVAGKIIDNRYDRPEDIVRDMALAQRNATINNQLYERLDQGGKNALDAFRMAQRGSKEFVRGEPTSSWTKPFALSAGLTAPVWAPAVAGSLPWVASALAAEQGLVHGLNTRLGKAVISGSPEAARSPLANAAIQAGLREALPRGALRAYSQE